MFLYIFGTMKTKPILIIAAIVIILAGTIFFVRSKTSFKSSTTNSTELTQFLYKFNNSINEGNKDTLISCFSSYKKNKAFKQLVNLLLGKDKNGEKLLANVKLDLNNEDIKNIYGGVATVTIPVSFSHGELDVKESTLIIKILKVATGKLKIIKIDAKQFFTDYVAYENFIKSKSIPDKDIYSAITLEAFKTASQLKTRYDSVLWFEHIDNKTFYYVIKGRLNEHFYWDEDQYAKEAHQYKMGLVNPDLKEIIPPEYDLVHNIGGTIDGLVEVEMNGKKGLYNLQGKNVVVVIYDQIIPLNDDNNLALLRKDDNYFYFKRDSTVTDKIDGFKITDILPKIKGLGDSYTISDKSSKNIMEFNSRENFTTMVVTPSYLTDLQLLPKFMNFQNPLRHEPEDEAGDGEGSNSLSVKFDGARKEDGNWFESAFYSVIDDYLGARSGLYETKRVLLVDKKQNRINGFASGDYFGNAEGGGPISGACGENYLRAINDTLFEFKTTSVLDQSALGLHEGPYYHYLHFQNGRLVALQCNRIFACTKFVKMDDSYLNGCFVLDDKNTIDHLTKEMLQYMKNEIYASYGYQFKSEKWTEAFGGRFDRYDGPKNINVNDSLTDIEKYNINWINSKLNQQKQNTLAAQ